MQIGGISPANKIVGRLFFLHVDMATHFIYARSLLSFMDRLDVAARNLDTPRIDPAIFRIPRHWPWDLATLPNKSFVS
jgi:hypothetical protein